MKQTVAIVGGGAAALSLAAFLDPDLFDVTIYEKNKSLGRKFLVAGKGGFNLTHAEPISAFVERYSPASFLEEAILGFTNEDFVHWLTGIGIPTYVGSSKRVFPEKGIKPFRVLDAILSVLRVNNVKFSFGQTWTGWNTEKALIFNQHCIVDSDIRVFALGGASWKVTGSDGIWSNLFAEKGIATLPFLPSNCAYKINWSKEFLEVNEGRPLKNIEMTCEQKTQKGELVITRFGLEGNAIYALSPQIQNALTQVGEAAIIIDLKPVFTEMEIRGRIESSTFKNTTEILRKDLKLSAAQINLLKGNINKDEFLSYSTLASKIKKLPLLVTASASLDEAISTTGGIDLGEVGDYYELHKLKGTYCLGEMLDWNAPTGGYLLQACFSMGVHLANHLNDITS
jgi:uncharacterized flavoprotein (TIGR03862 family)